MREPTKITTVNCGMKNKYKKQAAKNGNTDQNQKGQTYYIVVKNSKNKNR